MKLINEENKIDLDRINCHQPKTDEEREQYYKLRYDIYVEDLDIISRDSLPIKAGMEFDRYDINEESIAFLTFAPNISTDELKLVGCLRLILGDKVRLPCEDHFSIDYAFNRIKSAEISRLIVAPMYRSKYFKYIILSLTWEIRKYCIENDLDMCFAGLEKPVIRMLKIIGFPLSQVGPTNQYYGRDRIPVVFETRKLRPESVAERIWKKT